jgi:hypothetical protein
MQGDEERPASRLRISGLIFTLTRLIEEAAAMELPRTEIALRAALRLCLQEQNLDQPMPATTMAAALGMVH